MIRRIKEFFASRRRKVSGATIGVGIASAVALGVSIVMMVRRSDAATTRSNPGPGRTAVIGDSIVANTAGFVRFLDRALPNRSFDNFGVVGQGTASVRSDLLNRVIGHGYDEVIIEGGLNDFGRSDAVNYILNNLRTMVQEAKGAGLKVVLVTVTPYAAAAADIRQVNSVILRDGRSWGADAVVDINSPLANFSGGLRSELIGDNVGLHPNRRGQELIGQAILSRAYVD